MKAECRTLLDGLKYWYLNGIIHREHGPAIEDADGTKEWFQNGKLHREQGPAVEYAGTKYWYKNGELHRENGPAIEYPNGNICWCLNNGGYSLNTYLRKLIKQNIMTEEDAVLFKLTQL